jgi:photosystem II stability/assembly factor-like uncharacterized protein
MKTFFGRILPFSMAVVAILSGLSFNSCKKQITEVDTVTKYDTIYTHCPGDSSTWINRSTGTSNDLVIGAFRGNTGYVAGGHGTVLATNDAGNTWQMVSSVPIFEPSSGPGTVYGLSFSNASTLFAAGDQRVVTGSSDGAMNWNMMNTAAVRFGDVIRSLAFVSPTNGFIGTSDAYAAPSGTICATTDGGQSWEPVFNTNGGIYNIDFNGANGVATGRFGVNYWTNDYGATWHPGSSDVPNAMLYRTTFTSATTGFAVATMSATEGAILQTTDAGHTWTTIKSVPAGLQGIASNGNGTITAVGFNGAIVESTDGGATWMQSNAGTNHWLDIRYVNASRAVIVGANGQIFTRDK